MIAIEKSIYRKRRFNKPAKQPTNFTGLVIERNVRQYSMFATEKSVYWKSVREGCYKETVNILATD